MIITVTDIRAVQKWRQRRRGRWRQRRKWRTRRRRRTRKKTGVRFVERGMRTRKQCTSHSENAQKMWRTDAVGKSQKLHSWIHVFEWKEEMRIQVGSCGFGQELNSSLEISSREKADYMTEHTGKCGRWIHRASILIA